MNTCSRDRSSFQLKGKSDSIGQAAIGVNTSEFKGLGYLVNTTISAKFSGVLVNIGDEVRATVPKPV